MWQLDSSPWSVWLMRLWGRRLTMDRADQSSPASHTGSDHYHLQQQAAIQNRVQSGSVAPGARTLDPEIITSNVSAEQELSSSTAQNRRHASPNKHPACHASVAHSFTPPIRPECSCAISTMVCQLGNCRRMADTGPPTVALLSMDLCDDSLG